MAAFSPQEARRYNNAVQTLSTQTMTTFDLYDYGDNYYRPIYQGRSYTNYTPTEDFYPGEPPETALEKKLRVALERTRAAVALVRFIPPEPLPERLYHRPRRKGRACGSRHRVFLA